MGAESYAAKVPCTNQLSQLRKSRTKPQIRCLVNRTLIWAIRSHPQYGHDLRIFRK